MGGSGLLTPQPFPGPLSLKSSPHRVGQLFGWQFWSDPVLTALLQESAGRVLGKSQGPPGSPWVPEKRDLFRSERVLCSHRHHVETGSPAILHTCRVLETTGTQPNHPTQEETLGELCPPGKRIVGSREI